MKSVIDFENKHNLIYLFYKKRCYECCFLYIFKLKKKKKPQHLCDNSKLNSKQIIWYVRGISQILLEKPSTSESFSGKCDQLELLMMIFGSIDLFNDFSFLENHMVVIIIVVIIILILIIISYAMKRVWN